MIKTLSTFFGRLTYHTRLLYKIELGLACITPNQTYLLFFARPL